MPNPTGPDSSGLERQKLWDPFVRGFHWLLAFFVTAAWILGEFGPDVMTLHFWCGYAVAALLVLRLIWGLFGPRTARFTHFVRGPRAIGAYVKQMFRRTPSYWPGHNPLGALAVLAMLAALLFQVATGLVSDPDDFINVGPLASSVPPEIRSDAVGWHHLGALIVLVIVSLHLLAIFFYRLWKRENLVLPMLTGWKLVKREDTRERST